MTSEERPPENEPAAQPKPAAGEAADLVDRARKAYAEAKPRVERLVEVARPRVEKAAKDAAQYARDHDEEIKSAASALVRARARGPWRLALNAFGAAERQRRPSRACQSCGTAAVATAKFCTECGVALGGER